MNVDSAYKCAMCGEIKRYSFFYLNKATGKPTGYCKACIALYNKRYNKKRPFIQHPIQITQEIVPEIVQDIVPDKPREVTMMLSKLLNAGGRVTLTTTADINELDGTDKALVLNVFALFMEWVNR